MSISCIANRGTKENKYVPSKIYNALKFITQSNKLATLMWEFSLENSHLKKVGLPTDRDSTIKEFLNKNSFLYDMLDNNELRAKYINYDLDYYNDYFATHSEAMHRASLILNSHPLFSVEISYSKDGYKTIVVPRTEETKNNFIKEDTLSRLNNKLISFIENLGFTVKEVSGLSTPGVFAPKDATKNAEGLIQAILVAKGIEGAMAIPEEVSHLLAAGLHNNHIVQRLKLNLTLDIIKDILGELFTQYNNKYEGNLDRLKEEVLGKLIAQNLVNRNGLSEDIRYISNRVLNKVQDNLQKGDENIVAKYLEEANKDLEELTDNILNNESCLKEIDLEAIMNSENLYNVGNHVSELKKLADESFELLNKKTKLNSFKKRGISKEEVRKLNAIEKEFNKGRYFKGYTSFLKNVMDDCTEIYEDIKDIKESIDNAKNDSAKSKILKRSMKLLTRLEDIINAYSDIIIQYKGLSEIEGIEEELTIKNIKAIKEAAVEVDDILSRMRKMYSNLRLSTLLDFYGLFWKNDIEIKSKEGTSKITLQDVLESQMGDTTGFDRLVNSIADSKDPLLQLVHTAFQDLKYKMNQEAIQYEQMIAKAEHEYYAATGSRDTSWMYARDENGNLTGMFISHIDYNAYHKAHRQKYEELKALGLSQERLESRMRQWRTQNTELVTVINGRKEKRPKASKYQSRDLESLNEALLKYYNDIINIKKQLWGMVPGKGTELFKAPLKKVSKTDALIDKKSIKGFFKRVKEQYITTDQTDTDYGEFLQGEKYVVLDFNGQEVKRVPVYYNTKLDDMSLLDTHTGNVMIAYANMAVNYKHMNELADTMELTASLMDDRDITQMKGTKKLFYKYKIRDKVVQGDYVLKGRDSLLAQLLRYFIDSNIYGRRKKHETVLMQSEDKSLEFNYGKAVDAFKGYSTKVGMGVNLFSITSNIAMGEVQLFREAAGGEFFDTKDLLWAHQEYLKLRPKNAANAYSDNPNDRLTLLLKKFDCLNELNRIMEDSNYSNGLLRRLADKCNLLVGNQLGEHELLSVGMLAVLHALKVKFNNEIVPLTDVLEEVEVPIKLNKGKDVVKSSYWDIQVKKGAIAVKTDKQADLEDYKIIVKKVNRRNQGGYADSDKGAIHYSTFGRAIMHYRQWMPAAYASRFGGTKIDVANGYIEEGSYITAFKFLLNNIKDLKQFKFNIASSFGSLSDMEKANLRKCLFDALIITLLSLLLPHKESGDDEDGKSLLGIKNIDGEDPWLRNKFRLTLLRVRLEMLAMSPTLSAIKAAGRIIQTPAPAMENINNVLGLLDLSSLSEEVGRGRYEGWSKWAKNLFFLTPGVKNVNRFVDLINGETSMFKPYLD